LPPPTAARLEALRQAGRICIYAGRLRALEASPAGGAEATLATRDGSRVLHVDRVVNSTGPDTQFRQVNHPIVMDVIGAGLGRPDPLGLGFDVAPDGRLKDEDGLPTPGLYTLGWPRQGQLLEATTVPSLSMQAQDLAIRLLSEA
jgi:uncharacterized NAD(P)/FAD-binding protein YdhS